MSYTLGDNVIFLDENQCEIRGQIQELRNYSDHLYILIKLFNGGYYHAKLPKLLCDELVDEGAF